MARLTKNEQKAFVALDAAPNKMLGILELISAVYGKDRPASPRNSMASTMRMLILKTEGQPKRVVRTSALGRGNLGVYQIVE